MNDKQPVPAGVISPGNYDEMIAHLKKAKQQKQAVSKAVARLLMMSVVTELGGVASVSALMDEIEGPTFGIETVKGQRLLVTVSSI